MVSVTPIRNWLLPCPIPLTARVIGISDAPFYCTIKPGGCTALLLVIAPRFAGKALVTAVHKFAAVPKLEVPKLVITAEIALLIGPNQATVLFVVHPAMKYGPGGRITLDVAVPPIAPLAVHAVLPIALSLAEFRSKIPKSQLAPACPVEIQT